MLNFENIGEKFVQIVNTSQWRELQKKFNMSHDIYILGHGGNLAIADHAAVDITRLSNGTKNAIAPGSAIVATSLINDTDFDQWMVNWLAQRTSTRTQEQMKKSLVLGISSSGNSKDIIKALQWANSNSMEIAIISSRDIKIQIKNLTKVLLGAEYYHTSEVLTLLLTYELTHGSGNVCPVISKSNSNDLKKSNWNPNKIRTHSYPDEKINIGIDFDGVIHKCSNGYYDGTIYDEPIEGSYEALSRISKEYTIIVYTAKAKPDRGLVNGKTGTELVWEWLEKHDMSKFISKVTSEKPRAVCYIDDKGIEFSGWSKCIQKLKEKEIL
jgi:phosphoheptose isomerase